MSLPFLRPSPPPSALYLRSFFHKSATPKAPSPIRSTALVKPSASYYSTATSPPSSANPTGPPAAADTTELHSSSPGPAPSPPNPASVVRQQFEPLPFHIHRTASQQLPVYHDKKSGGTLKQTIVRKIEGDVDALRAKIIEGLGGLVTSEQVKINRLNNNIIIKGHIAKEVAALLRGLHF